MPIIDSFWFFERLARLQFWLWPLNTTVFFGRRLLIARPGHLTLQASALDQSKGCPWD